MIWIAVGVGGALGALGRHAVNTAVHARFGPDPFPLGILVVNVAGCLLAGAFGGLIASGRWEVPLELRYLVLVGLLGGFTTFSSFGLDTLTLVATGHYARAGLNVAGHLGLGLLAVWAGFAVASSW